MKLKHILITLLLVGVLIVVFLISRQAAPGERRIEASAPRGFARADAPYVIGEVLVRLKPGPLLSQIQAASLAQIGAVMEGSTPMDYPSIPELPMLKTPKIEVKPAVKPALPKRPYKKRPLPKPKSRKKTRQFRDMLGIERPSLGASTESLLSQALGIDVAEVKPKAPSPSEQPIPRSRGAGEGSIDSYQKLGLHREIAIKYKGDRDPVEVADDLMTRDVVEFAMPNYIFEIALTPNDPFYINGTVISGRRYQKWGLQKIESEYAWDSSQGNDVVAAILDTGVNYDHRDLAANIWNNTGEIANNDIDDDQNGLIDDTRGFDFNNCETWEEDDLGNITGVCLEEKDWDNDPMDDNGHGSHVAGIVAAVGNNNYHSLGSSFRTTIMPIKVANRQGRLDIWGFRNGIVYATNNGADIINISAGGRIEDEPHEIDFITRSIRYAHGRGVVIVTSAGNDDEDVVTYTPANLAETIAVAGTDENDRRDTRSNFGDLIDVAAPGTDILSTFMHPGSVVVMSGTSMSAPFVTGIAALLLSLNPNLTNEQVRNIIRDTTDPITTDQPIGTGRVNARRAVETLTDPADLTVTHSAPESVTAGSIFTYVLEVKNEGQSAAESVRTQTLIPASFSFVQPMGAIAPGQISCSRYRQVQCALGTVMRGQSRAVSLRFRVPTSECDNTVPMETKVITTSEEPKKRNNETDFDQPTVLTISITC
jgi:uncharacterized repeat protein (TIGR01451 family)